MSNGPMSRSRWRTLVVMRRGPLPVSLRPELLRESTVRFSSSPIPTPLRPPPAVALAAGAGALCGLAQHGLGSAVVRGSATLRLLAVMLATPSDALGDKTHVACSPADRAPPPPTGPPSWWPARKLWELSQQPTSPSAPRGLTRAGAGRWADGDVGSRFNPSALAPPAAGSAGTSAASDKRLLVSRPRNAAWIRAALACHSASTALFRSYWSRHAACICTASCTRSSSLARAAARRPGAG